MSRRERPSSTQGRRTSMAAAVGGGEPAAQQTQAQHEAPPAAAPPAPLALLPAEVSMDLLLSKLQLLDYEREFCRRKKPRRKPLAGHLLLRPPAAGGGGAGEQFHSFVALAAWLLQCCGLQVANPKEFDDPNATLQALASAAQPLGGGAAAALAAAPAARLATGWGPEVCALLEALAAAALERRGFRFAPPAYGSESAPEAEEEGGDDDAGALDMTEAAAAAAEGGDEEEGEEEYAKAFGGGGGGGAAAAQAPPGAAGAAAAAAATAGGAAAAAAAPERQALWSGVDPTAWKLEVERVAPRLRPAAAGDVRDWRQHLDAAHAHAAALSSGWPEARAALLRAASDAGGAAERLAAREAALNAAFAAPLREYAAARRALAEAQDEAAARADGVGARDAELHRLGAALEDAKAALEERGSSLSDASPLVRIKAAIGALKGELGGMEVRIGVVAHTLTQLSLSDKQAAARDAAARGGEGVRVGRLRAAAGGDARWRAR